MGYLIHVHAPVGLVLRVSSCTAGLYKAPENMQGLCIISCPHVRAILQSCK